MTVKLWRGGDSAPHSWQLDLHSPCRQTGTGPACLWCPAWGWGQWLWVWGRSLAP